MDSLRYWVHEMHVDGFRFDLAPRSRATPSAFDRNGAFLAAVAAGPGALAGQADRRALGPRRRRLPARQLPARLGGMERQVPRRRALASGAATPAWSASSPRASRARATCSSAPAASRRASVNFVTAHDGFTLHDLVSYERKHNEANLRGTTATAPTTTAAGTAASRADGSAVRRCGSGRAQPARDAAALAGRADASRRRRAGPHAARQQQRLLPGQRALLARLGPRRTPRASCLPSSARLTALRQRSTRRCAGATTRARARSSG